MNNSNTRRNFILKLAALSSTALIGIKSGFSINNSTKMNKKAIKKIRALGFQWETQDPFLFCVHHEDFFPKGNDKMEPDAKFLKGRNLGQDFVIKDGFRMYHGTKVPGFPSHPHRGFETVTVVRKGMVDHSDSLGGAGRYGNGDVQWMTAGKGVQHAEMFPLINSDKENTMELFQIWLNLPKANKFVEPHYKMLWGNTIPVINYSDENGLTSKIELIAGTFGKDKAPTPPPNSWAANAENEIGIWNIHMEANATLKLPKTNEEINRSIYFYKGDKLKIENSVVENYHAADLFSTHDILIENGNEKGYLLVLQGKPINEPVVQYGPFVMNSKQEIQEAFEDYQKTQFGGWPWPTNGPVHDKSKGRFADHGKS